MATPDSFKVFGANLLHKRPKRLFNHEEVSPREENAGVSKKRKPFSITQADRLNTSEDIPPYTENPMFFYEESPPHVKSVDSNSEGHQRNGSTTNHEDDGNDECGSASADDILEYYLQKLNEEQAKSLRFEAFSKQLFRQQEKLVRSSKGLEQEQKRLMQHIGELEKKNDKLVAENQSLSSRHRRQEEEQQIDKARLQDLERQINEYTALLGTNHRREGAASGIMHMKRETITPPPDPMEVENVQMNNSRKWSAEITATTVRQQDIAAGEADKVQAEVILSRPLHQVSMGSGPQDPTRTSNQNAASVPPVHRSLIQDPRKRLLAKGQLQARNTRQIPDRLNSSPTSVSPKSVSIDKPQSSFSSHKTHHTRLTECPTHERLEKHTPAQDPDLDVQLDSANYGRTYNRSPKSKSDQTECQKSTAESYRGQNLRPPLIPNLENDRQGRQPKRSSPPPNAPTRPRSRSPLESRITFPRYRTRMLPGLERLPRLTPDERARLILNDGCLACREFGHRRGDAKCPFQQRKWGVRR